MEASMSGAGARHNVESAVSGVSWGAIAAAAFVGAALALILLLLGNGLGFAAMSPWAGEGPSGKALAIGAIAWLVFTHLASSAITGYMAGRLRTKWSDVHTDEVYFRDTAHGLAAWAVGIVITAAFLTSAATAIVTGATKAATAAAGATIAAGAAGAGMAAGDTQRGGGSNPAAYFVDSMFRATPDRPRDVNDQPIREEATRIFTNAVRRGEISGEDRTYLAQTISQRTGLPPPDAEKRVNDVLAQANAAEQKAREAADAARKATAHFSLWMFLALLIGAFTASFTGTLGGRTRDRAAVTTRV